MKVRNSEEAKKALEALRSARLEQGPRQPAERAGADKSAKVGAEDTVNLNLGRLLQQELDPNEVAASRKAKVDEIKKLIASGQYKVSSEQVAQAFSQEISFEILTQGKPGADDVESE